MSEDSCCVGTHSRAGSLFDDGEPDNTPEKATLNLSGGSNDESVSLLAVGTAEGTVEVVSVSQGAVHPLAMNIVHSFKVCSLCGCRIPLLLLVLNP